MTIAPTGQHCLPYIEHPENTTTSRAPLTQAGDVAQEGAEAAAGEIGEHAEAFQAAIATLNNEQLAAVRDRFLELMTVEEAKLAPLRELLEQAQRNPRDMLQTAAEESFRRSAANIESVTGTLVAARNDAVRTAQAVALQQQQQQSGAGPLWRQQHPSI